MSTYNPIPLMPKEMHVNMQTKIQKNEEKKIIHHILPVIFFEWVGLWMTLNFFPSYFVRFSKLFS